ncbi:MAG: formate C-acetyltransferase/glycerol dehydratase family glycyl radical enzyme [Vicinamibacterales bacterium]
MPDITVLPGPTARLAQAPAVPGFIPDSVVHPTVGPTRRVIAGVERNRTVTPELFADRALAATRSFRATEGKPLAIRRALMMRRIVEEHPIAIQDGELIVGMKARKPRGSPVYPEINCSWVERDLDRLAARPNTPFYVSDTTKRLLREEVFPYWRGRQVYDRLMEAVPPSLWLADERGVVYHYFRSRTIAHINAGYDKVLSRGMNGIVEDVDNRLSRLRREEEGFEARCDFLESVRIACQAVVLLAEGYAAEARRLAALEPDPVRRRELLSIAEVCTRVPAQPARNFHEALQSFWFAHLALNLETDGHAFGPGRWDQYLYPYYRRNIDSGELTQEQAQELLDLMWVKFDEITLAKDSGESQTSSSYPDFQNLNIGGLGRDGRDVTNELSYMCLTALEHTRLPQPGLSAQVSSKTPPKFLIRCAELLRQGMGMPAMFNSDVLTLGMASRGKTLEDARASSLNGCVACFCDGKDRMASSGYFNLAKCLELALSDGVDRLTGERLGPATGNPAQFRSFDELLQAFRAQVSHFVAEKVRYDNIVRTVYATHCPVPFTSALIDDCVERALDWHAGGSRYKIATMSGVGIGTVADALSAIRTHVFETGTVTMAGLVEALDRDWKGFELLRETLVNKTPHYGNDDDRADSLAVLAQRILCEEAEKHTDVQGARYFVDLLPTTSHIALGELTGATPDGRRARAPLSEGVSPVQGRDILGPTAAANSVAKLDHARTNGTLLNMKIDPEALRTEEDLQKLAALIRSYFDQGGHHVQFNIVDRAVLEDAMAHPENHRDLIVRVAGYSDYFVLLSRDIQEEILSRTEHRL